MSRLKPHTEQIAQDLSHQHGFSIEAVRHMIRAIDAGWGRMASFDHPEFGGQGQWMQGGMIMLGEPLNHSLRARVDALCSEIARAHDASGPLIEHGSQTATPTWPDSLGTPSATGSQGDLHYAWFADTRRLALMRHGQLQVFDTGDHRISGVSQQQGNTSGNISFTSQNGPIDLASLTPVADPAAPTHRATTAASPTARSNGDDVFTAIERLGELRDRGLLTDEEFRAKKTELLSRL
ncbi:SHOCT domain-containing protein [Salinisphaera hydrothermalis]|uniref:SHOCT domain-containing protein n=1 Tax=Salinisphaera hydrothermalis (strain C41B8) TaxID=1304275 RepID=A0A084IPK4_SALHC|nr:SHOCT domain-containing protein [Salinisphaera hydrothermalis]KEZ78638.1 hypothetical protein C41B8_03446 [Salinisphaera hydrothermalis C41B8]